MRKAMGAVGEVEGLRVGQRREGATAAGGREWAFNPHRPSGPPEAVS